MITDDPATPGNGQWEVNVAYLEDRTAEIRDRSFPHIDLNYGLGDHIQLKYETGYLSVSGAETDGIKRDVDDSLLGIKWRFLDEAGPNLLLPVEVAHAFGSITLVSEIGYQYWSEQPNEWVVGVLGAIEVTKQLELMAEIRSVSERFFSGGDLIANVGLRQEIVRHLKLIAAVGTGLRNGTETTRFVGHLGFQFFTGQ